MKKNITVPIIILLLFLCGCTEKEATNSDTRFLLDTVATIKASCDNKTLDGAFDLCSDYEKILSRTIKKSDIYKLNETDGFVSVSEHTKKIVERSIYYSKLSNGKFDITICPVSMLWNFQNEVIPSRDEIEDALRYVDYHSIIIDGNNISTGNSKIDLGGIAKGYIADQLVEYFRNKHVSNVLISLGGNIAMIGEYNIGIKTPFKDEVCANIKLKDKTAVTSGIDQRFIKKNGKIYHHILDAKTGYGVDNSLASVTVIGNNSMDCDALSTVCVLSGLEDGMKIINNIKDTEAVFIERNGEISLSKGLFRENQNIYYK